MTPATSKQSMQSTDETTSVDPLESINAFWKVESGVLVNKTVGKATADDEKSDGNVLQFDPLVASLAPDGKRFVDSNGVYSLIVG